MVIWENVQPRVLYNEIQKKNEMLGVTVWPCPSQPAEKFTAPGSNIWWEVLLKKFWPCIRQFGAGFFGLWDFTDLLSQGSILTVARRILFYFAVVRVNWLWKEKKTNLIMYWNKSWKIPENYAAFRIHNRQRFRKWSELRVWEFNAFFITWTLDAFYIIFLYIPSEILCEERLKTSHKYWIV